MVESNKILIFTNRVIFLTLLQLSLFLSRIGLLINLPYISYISWVLTIRKIKSGIPSKNKKKILVLEKSHGIGDIKQIVFNKLDKRIEFLALSRIHLHIIMKHFENKNNNTYKIFIDKIFFYIKKKYNISLILSFNIQYTAEHILQDLSKEMNIKFLICQKESLMFPTLIDDYKKVLSKLEKFKGDAISVYNEFFKKMLSDSEYVKGEKVNVIGMPRADYLHSKINLNEFNEKTNKDITFFLIRPSAGLMFKNEKKSFNWSNLANDTLDEVLEFAKSSPEKNFVFKTKIIDDIETSDQQKKILRSKLKNCSLIHGGDSNKIILNSKFMICFHSTAILESLIAKIPVLIPYFDEYKEMLSKYTIQLSNSENIYLAKNISHFQKLLNDLSNNKICYKEGNYELDKNLIRSHIGNIDGKSSKRLANLIENLCN